MSPLVARVKAYAAQTLEQEEADRARAQVRAAAHKRAMARRHAIENEAVHALETQRRLKSEAAERRATS